MAKRKKKHPCLPNGFGQIRFLGSNRTNPYGVYPPATEEYTTGQMKPPKALCYVNDWYVGFAVLTAYKAGTYTPGMEKELSTLKSLSEETGISLFTQRILSDYTLMSGRTANDCPTFTDVYKRFYSWKYEGKKKYSDSTITSCKTAFKNCSALHNKTC